MLSTNEKSNISLGDSGKGLIYHTHTKPEYDKRTYQHLYILSDDEIKEGDWYIKELFNTLKYDWYKVVTERFPNDYKKIIATTDKSLDLPQPSQSFIEKYVEEYNKGNVIAEVLVEYETATNQVPNGTTIDWLKVNPKDNTITIKKVKDSWSREETVTLCLKMQHDYIKYKESCHYGPNMREITDWTDKWIEENL
jgi:hypothetical protein